jgi:hypothetical protein
MSVFAKSFVALATATLLALALNANAVDEIGKEIPVVGQHEKLMQKACGNCAFLKCCDGSCCDGNCINDKTCCPFSQPACGKACCQPGQRSVDAKSSTCAVTTEPMLLIYSGSKFLGQSGGRPLRILADQSLLVKGQAFKTGQVILSIDTPSGARVSTPTADAKGTFSVTITAQKFPIGIHKLVVSQGAVSTSIALDVERIQ